MTDDATLFPVRAHGHPRAPRLTRLELQGFKSFPNRTRFTFEPGITAIIGPNGSGKSNVADSVRWVLGEQGQSALRAKRTEDVIFSGGQGRAPAGMAEATLTFDNSDGWLPTEFVEVSVTRRAYRSGENQYLINGRKVRLKDVALLTSGLGQSHVVVGQGLVDAALSLRADERRGLFEHAADLAGLRLKLAEAERNLAETDANTARLSDVLIELDPRLKILERAARQAREWQGLRDCLRELQGGHYRDALITALAALDDTRAKADNAALTVDAVRAEVARLISAAEGATGRLAVAREQLNHYEAQRTAAEDRLRRQIHERGLTAVRFESLGKRRADMDDAREGLDERVAAVAADLTRMQSDLRDLERATTESRAAAARHNRDAEARRAAQSAIELRLAATAHDLADEERQQGELLRRRAVLLERADSLSVEQERLSGAIAERRTRIATLDSDAAEAAAKSAADDARGAALDTAVADLTLTLQTSRDEAAGALAAREELHARLGEATTRLDVLRRTRESGAELHRGVREVLAAGSDGRLDGILGAVAELLVVPEDLEVAVEATLGGRLHTIIVASWEQAAAAIKHLQRTGVGRATFHPLDAMRSGPAASLPPRVCDHPGILGNAGNRVSAPPEIAPVVAALLGQTLIVDELETAHAVLPQLAPDWSVATVTGEIVRADGSVTGGSEARESSSLGRERELRELPNLISELETSSATARERVAAADAVVRSLADSERRLEGERTALRAAADERRLQRERLAGWLAEFRDEQERAERHWQELRGERERTGASVNELDHEMSKLAESRLHSARTREEIVGELTALTATADVDRAAAEEGRRLAGLEERLRGERRREAGLRSQERALAEELALRGERATVLDRERAVLAAEFERLSDEVVASEVELAAATAQREPMRSEAKNAEIAAERLHASLQGARAALVERDRERDHAGFSLERAAQDLDLLRDRISDDLDLADADEVLGWEASTSPETGLNREAEISRLRERLRRVGYVGEDAVADFDRENAQQAFLREQLADVTGASAALHDLAADLRRTMRARFDETFVRVAAEFAAAFATLFDGGTAQLVLTTGDNGAEPGIDIIAQPPGKRRQNLALLSGGERALTAAALLFAILRVNPVPFCLLDEVDAALDEANVVRFREQLQELAVQTQVIVVTHNRGTIEIADTLYGISMGADGVSQVLSLRLSESHLAD